MRWTGAAAAAVLSGFSFTNWQNSNETEVYAVASCVVAAAGWLCLRWRATRGSDRSSRLLLLIAYLLGASIANHLLALLAGPAVLVFLFAHLLEAPNPDAAERKREWSQALLMSDADVKYTYADITKAKRLIGYDPKVSVRDGVERFWQWYKKVVRGK